MLLDEFDKETNAMINPDMVTEKIEGYGKEYSTLLSKIEFQCVCNAIEMFCNVIAMFRNVWRDYEQLGYVFEMNELFLKNHKILIDATNGMCILGGITDIRLFM